METMWIIVALFLPWLCGVAWLRVGWRQAPEGSWAILLGYGYFLGIFGTTIIMRVQDAVGLAQQFWITASVIFSLTVAGIWLSRTTPLRHWGGGIFTNTWRTQPIFAKLLFALIIAALAFRFFGLTLEVLWRPLYPWDAWMNWAPKTRVWFELKSLVPFVDRNVWLSQSVDSAYTIETWHYPSTVPLIQLWTILALDHWDDSLINLHWPLCGIALGLAFYGHTRLWGASPLTGIVFTYFLLSMPFVNTHVALAGYAEIWLASAYALAAMSYLQWARTKNTRQGILALLFALMCTQIKVPGLVWLLTFVPALAVLKLPYRALFSMLAIALLIFFSWYVISGGQGYLPGIGPFEITTKRIAIPYLGQFNLAFHAAWRPFITNYFLFANWHLFWFAFAALSLFSIKIILSQRYLLSMAMLAAGGFAFLFVVFFLTHHYAYALDYTTINRASFHMIPVLLFCCFVLWHSLTNTSLQSDPRFLNNN